MSKFFEPTEYEADMLASLVTEREANHTLHFFRSEGYSGGDFANALIKATCHADGDNKMRLQLAFPAEVAAVRLAQEHRSGIARLRTIAGVPAPTGEEE